MKVLYATKASATGGRVGRAVTADQVVDVTLTSPKELGGDGARGTNPEQLFALGYSACFLGALKFAAGKEKIAVSPDSTVTATVGIGARDDGKGFGIDVELAIHVPNLERSVVEDLVQKAHIVCPYSEATRGNLNVRLNVV